MPDLGPAQLPSWLQGAAQQGQQDRQRLNAVPMPYQPSTYEIGRRYVEEQRRKRE